MATGLAERFEQKIIEHQDARTPELGPCWLWTGCTCRDGYGQVKIDGRKVKTHRAFFQLLVGEIPAGYDLDHGCYNRNCCNPAHLEPVSRSVNSQRANHRRWVEGYSRKEA